MLTQDQLDRVAVVLIRARNPNNIGAVARAMHDFGFRDLRIVNEYTVAFQDARSAVDASEVIAAAREFASVAEAVADCSLVAGTTAVGERDLDHPLHELPHAASLLRAALATPDARIALLFGSEKTGLSNEELSHCNWLMTIPMHRREGTRHPSMNLGQAAAVCLFELVRDASTSAQAIAQQPTAGDLERLTTLLTEVLERTGYSRRHPANCDPAQLRRLTRRMVLDPRDAAVWTGILRQVVWKLNRSTDASE
ncbi:RNA methyltransferase [Granulicella arctica]|uniref:RNA methyltransferase n=1 Tax=Granulicella arctica TaxID=940613 RepID=UPI0021DF5AD3|nr:TrmJ/YjtD family RNA methyltransferase [Granulicella arctica]